MKITQFVIFTSLSVTLLAGLLSEEDAYAEFSYGDKIEFVIIIEEMKGHLVAASQNHIDGNQELASLHLLHPIIENKPQLDALSKQPQTSKNTELALSMIKNTSTDLENENFVESLEIVCELLDDIKESVLGIQDDSTFQLITINHLLQSSKSEYEMGKTNANMMGIMEMQDSYAFVKGAHMLFEQINTIPTQDKNDVDVMFTQLLDKHKQEKSTSSISKSTDQIIHKINEIINGLDHNKSHEKKIPEWVKARVIWWTEEVIDDKTFALGIEFLIEQDIIQISAHETSDVITTDSSEIPIWVKNLSNWWIVGDISDDEFLAGITFLVEKGIINAN